MHRPKYLTYTTSGNQTPFPLDRYVNGYAIAATMQTAGIVYTLQYSLRDPYGVYTTSYAVSGDWFNWDDPLLVKASTNRSTNLAFIPAAIRVGISAKCSALNPLTVSIIPMGMDL